MLMTPAQFDAYELKEAIKVCQRTLVILIKMVLKVLMSWSLQFAMKHCHMVHQMQTACTACFRKFKNVLLLLITVV